jgi:hypothetical protein
VLHKVEEGIRDSVVLPPISACTHKLGHDVRWKRRKSEHSRRPDSRNNPEGHESLSPEAWLLFGADRRLRHGHPRFADELIGLVH